MAESAQKTPLYAAHVKLGAQMREFAGWVLPIQYGAVLEECRAVRSGVGLFDVSHMARFEVSGEDTPSFLHYMMTGDLAGLALNHGCYTLLCQESGGIVDDLTAFRLEWDTYLLVGNAANAQKDYNWLTGHIGGWRAKVEDQTPVTYMLAFQGPEAAAKLQEVIPSLRLGGLASFDISQTLVGDCSVLVSRIGYTGEDGFGLIGPAEDAERIWELLLKTGARPCGLEARDILRLEASLPLYGKDIDSTTNPFEAGLDWVVDLRKEDFHGKAALAAIKEAGPSRKLVPFEMVGRGVPHQGYPVKKGRKVVGTVTSGGYSPTLDVHLGLAYVPVPLAAPGTDINIVVRGKPVAAKVVAKPFYEPSKT